MGVEEHPSAGMILGWLLSGCILLRDIDVRLGVRLGETNGKEASLESALDSSVTALAGVEAAHPTIPGQFCGFGVRFEVPEGFKGVPTPTIYLQHSFTRAHRWRDR